LTDGSSRRGTGGMGRSSSVSDFRHPAPPAEVDDPEETFASLRILPVRDGDDSDIVPLHEDVSPGDMTSTFCEDCRNFTPGSMPHSAVVGTTIGIFCGVVAYLYYTALEYLLELVWHDIPNNLIEPHISERWYWTYIPVVGLIMAVGVGASVKVLGEPGDLSYTVQCVHDKAYITMDHVLPMLAASQFSILGGGSLGPEAPLVAICASFSGYISRKVFGMTRMNLVRKHTLMGKLRTFVVSLPTAPCTLLTYHKYFVCVSTPVPGMACALAAFFGVPLGGSLFALEINNRFGIEYYEHLVRPLGFCLAFLVSAPNFDLQ